MDQNKRIKIVHCDFTRRSPGYSKAIEEAWRANSEVMSILPGSLARKFLGNKGSWIVGVIRLLWLVRIHRPSIVHIQWFPLAERGLEIERHLIGWLKTQGVSVIGTAHNLSPHDSGPDVLKSVRAVYRTCTRLVTFSSSTANILSSFVGVREEHVAVIQHGPLIRTETAWTGSSRIVLAPGQIRPYKGLDLLIRAWARLSSEFADVELVIIGASPGGEAGRLARLAVDLSVSDRVRIIARAYSEREICDLYSDSLAIVLPYRRSFHSGSLVDALASGCPVVVARTPFAEEITNQGEAAILFGLGSEEDLEIAMNRVLADQEEARQKSAAALLCVTHHCSWKNAAESLGALMTELVTYSDQVGTDNE